ncbi:unnamed protein product [Acanthosepion pharaonis]|uniref:Uncharacterized protein n=1 Tax=Acanthosepion pharaonis TaxID=158019 RepID=A0A812E1F3_ACAPH|nr:unnamed protein product [Sepia pharaonis]
MEDHLFQRTKDDERAAPSIEDIAFLNIMELGAEKDKDHSWVAPLPFRSPRRRLPYNRKLAESRLSSPRRSLDKKPAIQRLFTRRGVLSTLNSLYDPLGFAAPVTIQGKLILRELIHENSEWDSPLPQEMHKIWSSWRDSLEALNEVRIPRAFTNIPLSKAVHKELHIFSDASTKAIAAVAYLKVTDDKGNNQIGFVTGKAKLARPEHSVPRLELCAALLATELSELNTSSDPLPGLSFSVTRTSTFLDVQDVRRGVFCSVYNRPTSTHLPLSAPLLGGFFLTLHRLKVPGAQPLSSLAAPSTATWHAPSLAAWHSFHPLNISSFLDISGKNYRLSSFLLWNYLIQALFFSIISFLKRTLFTFSPRAEPPPFLSELDCYSAYFVFFFFL